MSKLPPPHSPLSLENQGSVSSPLLSVVVPIFKVEKYLHKCVESLLDQNYENIEIILVDDGSPDKCPEICDEYSNKFANIKVIHRKNGGLSAARNTGLDMAKGEYVTFVDSDDWIESNVYGDMMELCRKYSLDIIASSYRYIRPWKIENKILQGDYDKSFKVISANDALYDLYFGPSMFVPITIMVPNKIYRRDLFNKIRFPEGYIYEDTLVTPKLLNEANTIGVYNRLLYNYNIHLAASSISGMEFNILKARSSVEISRQVMEYFKNSNQLSVKKRVSAIYYNNLLNSYYHCWRNRFKEKQWANLKKEYKKTMNMSKKEIKSISYSLPYKFFFLSPSLFLAVKCLTLKFKKLIYRLKCLITRKN